MSLTHCAKERLDPAWCYLTGPGTISLVEDAGGGEAKVTFVSEAATLHLRHLDDQPPLKWLSNRKCADDALITETSSGLCLHVIEIKSKLTVKEWIKVKKQLEGMTANAIALLAVIDAPRPVSVVCHVCYKTESVSAPAGADLILLKMQVGRKGRIVDTEDWSSETLSLLGYNAPIRKIVRDPVSGEGEGDLTSPV